MTDAGRFTCSFGTALQMCFSIKCGGDFDGATIIAVSAADALRQADRLDEIGVFPIQIIKDDKRSVSRFEVALFATERPIMAPAAPRYNDVKTPTFA